ncbi:MAG: replicative DNA helicase [Bacteroidetes bacterium]|nr:replicative DNA helicase [Bacteroidota bacterium]
MAKKYNRKETERDNLNEDFDFKSKKDFNIPPNAQDFEQMLLGAILIDNQVMNEILQHLTYEHFYIKKNQHVFHAMTLLNSRLAPIDIHILEDELKKMKVIEEIGGIEYLLELVDSVSTSANSVYYARIIAEKHILRNLINISSRIVEKCLDSSNNTFSILDEAEQKILDISESLAKKKVISVKDEIEDIIIELNERRTSKGVEGVPTGYDLLDGLTGGFHKSELIVIAGRPSHGKTAFAMNIASNAAIKFGKKVAIFSLEMSYKELVYRLLASVLQVDGKKLKLGKLPNHEWQKVAEGFGKLKTDLYIDDSSELSILEIRAKARRLKHEHNIDMVVVDYLQLVRGQDDAERRDLEVAYVSRGLKALAKELQIPVVACAQLNRNVETKATKDRKPQLGDLRESGAIEQDADMIIFVNRPIIGLKIDRNDPSFLEMSRKAEIVIGKQRNGPIGDFELVFLGEYATFENKDLHSIAGIVEQNVNGNGNVPVDQPF